MGSRFLKYNIENPLTSKKEIERRYELVEKLGAEFILRDDLINELDKVYDFERLVGRISYGNLNAKDVIQLKMSIKALPDIKKILEELKYDKELTRRKRKDRNQKFKSRIQQNFWLLHRSK